MLKRARHPPGFYASLFDDARDRGCNLKYWPKSKPIAVGVYEVERSVAKRIQGNRSEFFVQWWELSEHIPEELIAAFESRCVDPVRTDECKERLALLFEKGLKSPFGCNETITMRHDVLRSIFPRCRPTSVALCTWSLKRNCWLQDLALTWGEFWPWLVAVVTWTLQWSWNCSLANRLPS